MIVEHEFEFHKKPIEIFNSLKEENKKPIEIENDISMVYIGKNNNEIIVQIENALKANEISNNKILTIDFPKEKNENRKNEEEEEEEEEDNKNILFLIQYKNIYLGGISLNFNLREGFGINKYENSSLFYIGQWKNNMKEGIGFLKIDENTLYIGSFINNQFQGFGILYYKSYNKFYFGEFENGKFSEGIYCDFNNELYYRGKFNQNKKNDSFCSFLEQKNRHLFIGEVIDDEFIKGYLCLFNIQETARQDENGMEEFVAYFDIDSIFYYNKNNDNNNISFINNLEFENEFRNKIQENMKKIFETDYKISHKMTDVINYFKYLESLESDEDYNFLERYIENDEQSLEKFFIRNYSIYLRQFQEEMQEININEIRNEIEIPVMNRENFNTN